MDSAPYSYSLAFSYYTGHGQTKSYYELMHQLHVLYQCCCTTD